MGSPLYVESFGTVRRKNNGSNEGTYSRGKEKDCPTRDDRKDSKV